MSDDFDSSLPDASTESFDLEPEPIPEIDSTSEIKAEPESLPDAEPEAIPEDLGELKMETAPEIMLGSESIPESELEPDTVAAPEFVSASETTPENTDEAKMETTSEVEAMPEIQSEPRLTAEQFEAEPVMSLESDTGLTEENKGISGAESRSDITDNPESVAGVLNNSESTPEITGDSEPTLEVTDNSKSTPEFTKEPEMEAMPELAPEPELLPSQEQERMPSEQISTGDTSAKYSSIENNDNPSGLETTDNAQREELPDLEATTDGNKETAPEYTGDSDFVLEDDTPKIPESDSQSLMPEMISEQAGLVEEGSPEKQATSSGAPEANAASVAQASSGHSQMSTLLDETDAGNAAAMHQAQADNIAQRQPLKTDYPEDDLGKAATEINNENADINQTDAVLKKQTEQTDANRAEFRAEAEQYGMTPEQYLDYLGQRNKDPENTPELRPFHSIDTRSALKEEVAGDLPAMPADINIIKDVQDRNITIRRWGDEGLIQLRAYDSAVGDVPETPNLGTAGMTNLKIEENPEGQTKVRLQDIVIPPDYRNSDIAGNMLNETIGIAQAKGASEIYGVIENEEALNYWSHMEKKGTGWKVDSSEGAYGHVRYDLSASLKKNPKVAVAPMGIPVSTSIPAADGTPNSASANELTVEEIQQARADADSELERDLQEDLQKFEENTKKDTPSTLSPTDAPPLSDLGVDNPPNATENKNLDSQIPKKIDVSSMATTYDAIQDQSVTPKELSTDEIRQVLDKTIESANDIKDLNSKNARKNLYQKYSMGTLAEQLCYESTGSTNLNEVIPSFPWADGTTPTEIQQIKSHVNMSVDKALAAYSSDLSELLGGGQSTIDTAVDNIWDLRSTDKWASISKTLPSEVTQAEDKTSLKNAMLSKATLRVPSDDVQRLQDYVRKNVMKNPQKYHMQNPSEADVENLIKRIKPISPNISNNQLRLMAKDVFQRKMEASGFPRGVSYRKHIRN